MSGEADAFEQHLDSIINELTQQGSAYDRGAAARPNTDASLRLTDQELEALFQRSGLSRRVVTGVVGHATRKGWRVEGEGIDSQAVADADEELGLVAKLSEALTWARLYGGGALLPVTDETGAPKMDQPIDPRRVTRLRGLAVLAGVEATVQAWDDDILSPTFKEPAAYSVAPVGGLLTTGGNRFAAYGVFHASRLVHIRGDILPPAVERATSTRGQSVLQAAWDQLRNLTSVEQASATLATEFSIPVVKVSSLAAKSGSDGAVSFESRMRILAKSRSSLGLILLAQGEEFTRQAVALTGWNDLVEQAKAMVCAVTGEPATILFGQAPAGLSTDDKSGDRAVKERVASFQDLTIAPALRSYYRILFASKKGPTKGKVPPRWRIVFNPLDEPTEDETAATRKTVAETDKLYVDMGVYLPEDVTRGRFGKAGWSAELGEVTAPPPPEEIAPDGSAAYPNGKPQGAAADPLRVGGEKLGGDVNGPPAGA